MLYYLFQPKTQGHIPYKECLSTSTSTFITIILFVQKDPHASLPLDKRILLLPPKNLQMIHNRTLPSAIIQPKLRLFTRSQMLSGTIMRNKNLIILFPIITRPLCRINNPIITMIPFPITSISGNFLLTTEW